MSGPGAQGAEGEKGDVSLPHRHQAYGLTIASSIPIPEMPVAPPEAPYDVVVRTGPVPEHLESPRRTGPGHEVDATSLLLRIDEVARYQVARGTEIVVDPYPGADPHEVRVFLLGTCIGTLLHQRGFLVVHASGIGSERGAALFAGGSGAGKSTILAEMLRRGHRMMVDDVCAVRFDDATPIVLPSYPRTRLWRETADRLEIAIADLPRTRPSMDKYERQVPEHFWPHEAPLRRVYQLLPSTGDELSLTRVDGIESFFTLDRNTYRRSLIDALDHRREHFDLVSRAAANTTVVWVVRPVEGFRLAELADLIEEDLADD